MTALIAVLTLAATLFAWADEANPYFRAIHCKAVWSELTAEEKARIPGSEKAITAIEQELKRFVASGAKTARAIDADISDFKAYSSFEAHQMKDWRACVAHYAPSN